MYEEKTFEYLMGSMLAAVNEQNPDLDTQVGSVIYTALAPMAMELETAYRELNGVLEETFLGTASREYLIKHGSQLGVEINPASFTHLKGEFNVDVPIGSRFNFDEFNYSVIEKLSEPTEDNIYYTFEVICETPGTKPNYYLGDLTPITYVENLSHAKLISVLIYGEDEEDTESYRYRLQVHTMNSPVDGNVAQYEEWLNDYEGIGKYKVTPLWNGANTVKLTILNPENTSASTELINKVQESFDPITSPGMGDGLAPIGAVVTVDTCTEVPVLVECSVVLKDGYTSLDIVKTAVDNYIKSLILTTNKISYMPIAAEIYKAEGVADLIALRINVKDTWLEKTNLATIESVTLDENEIPVLDSNSSFVEG